MSDVICGCCVACTLVIKRLLSGRYGGLMFAVSYLCIGEIVCMCAPFLFLDKNKLSSIL
jgi:hypothetical protein